MLGLEVFDSFECISISMRCSELGHGLALTAHASMMIRLEILQREEV